MTETVTTTAAKTLLKKLDSQPISMIIMLACFAFCIYTIKTVAEEYKAEIKILQKQNQECQRLLQDQKSDCHTEIIKLLQRNQL